MTTYVCVAAKRIQSWMSRTPELKLLRGASQALRVETSAATVDRWLRSQSGLAGVRISAEAGDVDGVVVLEAPAHDVGLIAARHLLDHLGGELPGLEWAAWVHDSDSYVRAFSEAEGAGRPAATCTRLLRLPTTQELGIIRSCQSCRHEVALGDNPPPNAEWPEGPDCRHRRDEAVSDSTWPQIDGSWPDDFDQLAQSGGLSRGGRSRPQALGRRDSRNHLATIAADGNRIGAFFEELADAGEAVPSLRMKAVERLDTAMRDAVVAAARAASGDRTRIKVAIPHYVGGDDVLASVPAPTAWQFVSTLATTFESLRTQLLRALAEEPKQPQGLLDAIGRISLGIGVVFAHASHPLAECQALAHEAMKAGKEHGQGQSSAIGWIDITAGDNRRDPFVVDAPTVRAELDGSTPQVDVFRLTPSARAQLATIVRADGIRPRAKAEAVATWAARTGNRLDARLDDLPAQLSRARWWPLTEREQPR